MVSTQLELSSEGITETSHLFGIRRHILFDRIKAYDVFYPLRSSVCRLKVFLDNNTIAYSVFDPKLLPRFESEMQKRDVKRSRDIGGDFIPFKFW